MASQSLIAVTTGAIASSPFELADGEAATIARVGTYATAEYARLQIHNGATWIDVQQLGTNEQIDDTNSVMAVYAPGRYRVNKSATAAAAGVAIYR